MSEYVDIAIRGLAETTGWGFGEWFLDSMRFGDGIRPDQVSNNPDKFKKDSPGFDEAESFWACKGMLHVSGGIDFYQDFAWRRRAKPRFSGWITHKSRNLRGATLPSSIRMTFAMDCAFEWFEAFKHWCCLAEAQIAMLHAFTGFERCAHPESTFRSCGLNALIKPTLSGIPWAVFFGNEMLVDIDVEKISMAGFFVDKLDDGAMVRVTEFIADVSQDFPAFDAARNRLRLLLPNRLFPVVE